MSALTAKVLKFVRRGLAPVRVVALLCAVAILAAGFAHSLHQAGEPIASAALLTDYGDTGDGPETTKKPLVSIEHCFGCSIIVLAQVAMLSAPQRLAADVPNLNVDDHRPHSPPVEIPPPIAAV